MRALLPQRLALGGCPAPAPPVSGVPSASGTAAPATAPPAPALVLVSIDGLRAEALAAVPTPALDRIGAGVRAAGLQPPFPSSTFPSHWSMATGQEPGDHGIVSNRFWDPVRGEAFRLGDPDDMVDPAWWGGTPLWNQAEAHGIQAATLFWPGSEAPVGGRQATTWLPYDGGMPDAERVDRVLAWLDPGRPADERPGFVTLYFSGVDKAGHVHGPESAAYAEAIMAVDAQLGRLLAGLDARGLAATTDLVVVSDHGMAPRDHDKIVHLSEAGVDLGALRVADWSPVLQIHEVGDEPARAALAATLGALPHLSCHTKATTPADWHYRSHRAIGEVVCLADRGWSIARPGRVESVADTVTEAVLGGSHGWDPSWPAMHGVFLATGPRVAQGRTLPVLRGPEVHAAVCALLGIPPAEGAVPAPWADQILAR